MKKVFGGGTAALEEFTMDVRPIEIFCLLGPSGCGKSTVPNLIARFESPTSGGISLEGRPITQPGPDRGVIFQEHALFLWLTVVQNIAFGKRLRGGVEDEARYGESGKRSHRK